MIIAIALHLCYYKLLSVVLPLTVPYAMYNTQGLLFACLLASASVDA